jgi:hypothetical protein
VKISDIPIDCPYPINSFRDLKRFHNSLQYTQNSKIRFRSHNGYFGEPLMKYPNSFILEKGKGKNRVLYPFSPYKSIIFDPRRE